MTYPNSFWYWLALFFGAGLSRFAPGTIGTIASLVIWIPLVMLGAPWYLMIAIISILFFLGLHSCKIATKNLGQKDSPQIVIDEVVGMGLSLIFCPASFFAIFIGFILFRIFDILKVWPINYVDEQLKDHWGIMLDDILAGIYASIILALISALFY